MLDPQFATAVRSRLRQRATQLREEIRATLSRSEEETHARVAELARDTEDDAFADLVVDTNLAEVTRDMGELQEIDAAMQRLLDGGYGTCVDCGRKIPYARLEAQPTAKRDIECQEKFERMHSQTIGPTL